MPEPVKKARSREALSLAKECARGFQERFLGTALEVLWEKQAGGVWSGLTGNYIKVYARSTADLSNRILPAELERIYRDGVWGSILE